MRRRVEPPNKWRKFFIAVLSLATIAVTVMWVAVFMKFD